MQENAERWVTAAAGLPHDEACVETNHESGPKVLGCNQRVHARQRERMVADLGPPPSLS